MDSHPQQIVGAGWKSIRGNTEKTTGRERGPDHPKGLIGAWCTLHGVSGSEVRRKARAGWAEAGKGVFRGTVGRDNCIQVKANKCRDCHADISGPQFLSR
jgi:hypothetical protein